MFRDSKTPCFKSILAPLIEQFIKEKRACGYRYQVGAEGLAQLDRYLLENKLDTLELPKPAILPWIAKRDHESQSTQHHRICLTRQFAQFMIRHGYPAYIPDSTLLAKTPSRFTPYVFTHEEIGTLFKHVEQITSSAHSPYRHLVMPEVFHLLYACGFRIGEVLDLRVGDVDLNRGLITVREGKLLKDRLVPPAPALIERLQTYEDSIGHCSDSDYYFPSPSGKRCSYSPIVKLFHKLLYQSGIPYRGRGKGPRLHDLRHTFAVHALMRWYKEGIDLNAKLPLLATYMGHAHLRGTQYYLHLTAEFFPDILTRVNSAFGDVIPQRVAS